ncbi:DNA-binding protein [Parafrankia colletiae]|uniref:DNA-binding protein n=1 Tax=Parafrankia colletiae TaxID=573497 RepID=A0A1S1QZY5_9ACTN|nr:PIN domain-containing protein [Parafrankia colletiae]MCK9899417.1 PIN domain-containing protein [Frankia sp. Cpl3]OHV38835.1 DNA-binding protein [Parafrankia colletiae]
MRLVLDAEAVNALLHRDHHSRGQVRNSMRAAIRLQRDVVVPTIVLAELYRGAGRSAAVDALLARDADALSLRDTDRSMARLAGAVLAQAGLGSRYLADAHAVAAAVEGGGGVILTGDPADLARLAGPYPTVAVEPLASPGGRGRS